MSKTGELMVNMAEQVAKLVAKRNLARERKDYTTADALKKEILAIRIGTIIPYRVSLQDTETGTEWHWTV